MRELKSSRKGREEFQTHYCPEAKRRVDLKSCTKCRFMHAIDVKPVSYTVQCWFPSDLSDLLPVTPAKATAAKSLPKRLGTDPLAVPTHTAIEPKLDGARAFVHLVDGQVRVHGRRRNQGGLYSEFGDNIPHIRDLTYPAELEGTVFDGELILEKERTEEHTGTLGWTMSIVGSHPDRAASLQEEHGRAHIIVFDMLYDGGINLMQLSLFARRSRMTEVLERWRPFFIHLGIQHTAKSYRRRKMFLDLFLSRGYEGAIVKDLYAAYGARHAWLKVKPTVSYDALVTGFDYGSPGSKYEDTVGSLVFSVLDAETGQLREICSAIPGDDSRRASLLEALEDVDNVAVRQIIAEVQGQNWTKEYRLRHPRVVRYRVDRGIPETVDFSELERS